MTVKAHICSNQSAQLQATAVAQAQATGTAIAQAQATALPLRKPRGYVIS